MKTSLRTFCSSWRQGVVKRHTGNPHAMMLQYWSEEIFARGYSSGMGPKRDVFSLTKPPQYKHYGLLCKQELHLQKKTKTIGLYIPHISDSKKFVSNEKYYTPKTHVSTCKPQLISRHRRVLKL